MSEPGQRLFEHVWGELSPGWPSEAPALRAQYARAEAALLKPYVEALEELAEVADATGWAANVSMMDEAITRARALLSTTEGKGHD